MLLLPREIPTGEDWISAKAELAHQQRLLHPLGFDWDVGIVRAITWKENTLGFLPRMVLSAVILLISEWMAERYGEWKRKRTAEITNPGL